MKQFINNFLTGTGKFLRKYFSYVLLGVLIVSFAVCGFIGMGNNNSPSSYFQTNSFNEGGAKAFAYKITYGEKEKLNSVWLSFGSLDHETEKKQVKITAIAGEKETSYFSRKFETTFDNTLEGMNVGSYVNIAPSDEISMGYTGHTCFVIAFDKDSTFNVNEVAFVGTKENGDFVLLKAECIRGGAVAKTSLSGTLDSMGINTSAVEYGNKLIDEQGKFDVNRIDSDMYEGEDFYITDKNSVLTPQEYYTAESIRNFIAKKSNVVDSSLNPIGNYLLALGPAMFGYNPVGMRILPLLFTLGTLALIFFVGKLITKNSIGGLLLATLFAVCGFSLGFATLGGITAIVTFFEVLCLYFLFRFYRRGIKEEKATLNLLDFIFAGLSFAMAFALSSTALYFIIGILAVLGICFAKHFREHIIAIKDGEIEESQNNKQTKNQTQDNNEGKNAKCKKPCYLKSFLSARLSTIATCGLLVVIFPLVLGMITFLLGYSTYSAQYEFTSVIEYAFAHISACLKGCSPIGAFDGVIGKAYLALSDSKFIFGNVALSFVTILALIGAIVAMVFLFVKNKGRKGFSIKYFVLPFIASFVSFIFIWVLNAIVFSSLEGFYTALIFAFIGVTAFYNYANKKFNKALFNVKGISVTLTNVITIVTVIVLVVFFAIALEGLLGFGSGLINVNVLGF